MAEKTNEQQQDLSEILRIRREKLSTLQQEGRDPFQETKYVVSRHAQEIKDQFEQLEGSQVSVAGRLMSQARAGAISQSRPAARPIRSWAANSTSRPIAAENQPCRK